MAKPVAVVPDPAHSPEGAREELRRRIEKAPLEHAAALLSLWDLLQAAHDNHALEIARGALSASNDIIERLASGARSEGAVRAMRNAILLGQMLGSIDPEVLHDLVHVLPGALASVHDGIQRQETPSLFQIFRRLASRDALRAQGLLVGALTALGRTLLLRSGSETKPGSTSR